MTQEEISLLKIGDQVLEAIYEYSEQNNNCKLKDFKTWFFRGIDNKGHFCFQRKNETLPSLKITKDILTEDAHNFEKKHIFHGVYRFYSTKTKEEIRTNFPVLKSK